MGDMNAKVGEGRVLNIVGPYGLGTRNENGDVDWCKEQTYRHQYLLQATSQTTLYLDKPRRQST